MKKRGMNLAQALEHVKSRRPKAAPNVGFMVQLKDFEMALQGRFCATETARIRSSFSTFRQLKICVVSPFVASKEEQKLSNV